MQKTYIDTTHNIYTLRIVLIFLLAIGGFSIFLYKNYYVIEINSEKYMTSLTIAATFVFIMLLFVLNFILRKYIYKIVIDKDYLILKSLMNENIIKFKDIISIESEFNLFVGNMTGGQIAVINLRNEKQIKFQLTFQPKEEGYNFYGIRKYTDFSKCELINEIKQKITNK